MVVENNDAYERFLDDRIVPLNVVFTYFLIPSRRKS